jgi:hypothetical protein
MFISACNQNYPEVDRIISPQEGDVWPMGTVQTIEWTGSGISTVSVYIRFLDSRCDDDLEFIAEGGTSGRFEWKVEDPNTRRAILPGPYKIKIIVKDTTHSYPNYRQSGRFTIIE